MKPEPHSADKEQRNQGGNPKSTENLRVIETDYSPFGFELSSLDGFFDFFDQGISEVRTELQELKSNSKPTLEHLTIKVGKLCMESDAWGFDDLHRIGWEMHQVLLGVEAGGRTWNTTVVDTLGEALRMLSDVLSECRKDYLRRTSVAKLIESLAQAGRS